MQPIMAILTECLCITIFRQLRLLEEGIALPKKLGRPSTVVSILAFQAISRLISLLKSIRNSEENTQVWPTTIIIPVMA